MTSARVLDGRYQLIEALGQGATGRVWLAHDLVLDRRVAVKQLIADVPDADTIARAVQEAKLAGRLQHPNAVSVHDLVTVDGRPHVVMEYIEGRSLAELSRQHSFPVARIAEILGEIASALATAHELGIVHRDVKPSNIMIMTDGRAKLADFGIARSASTDVITETGLIIGTLAYMAPEVAGGSAATPASDVWSLGATAFALTEGHPPYQAASDVDLYGKLINQDPPRPVRAGPLSDPIQRMMQRDPHRRPATRAMQREMAQLGRTAAGPAVAAPAAATAPSLEAAPTVMLPSAAAPPYEPPQYEPLPAIRSSTPPVPQLRGDTFGQESAPGFFAGGGWNEPPSGPLEQFLDKDGYDSSGYRPTEPRHRSGLLIAIAVVVVLIVAGGVAAVLLRGHGGSTSADPSGSAPTGSAASASPTAAASARYTAPGGIAVTGPAGWTKSPGYEVDRISSLSPTGTADKDSATYFRFGKGSTTPATDFNAVVRESVAFIQNSSTYTNKQVLATRSVTFQGVPAADIEWTGRTPGGSDRHLVQRVWLSKTVTWLIQVNSPAAQWDSTYALFTQLTSTCTVT